MTRDLAHDDWVAEARAVPLLDAAERLGLRLRRVGHEHAGPCPVCGGRRDKLSLHPGRGVWNCGHAGGEGGDVIALVRHVEGSSFLAACETLTGRPSPRGDRETEDERRAREATRARRASEAAERDAERIRLQAGFREAERQRARRIWDGAGRAEGSPVEAYLAHRAVALPPGARLRHARDLPYHAADAAGRMRAIGRGPAMVAAITDADGVFRGVHLTWLDPVFAAGGAPDSAASGKAEIADPQTGELLPAKKVRGSQRGHRIELVRVPDPVTLVLGEGIETVLSVWRAFALARPDLLPGTAFWSAISLGNLSGPARRNLAHPTLRRVNSAGADCPVMVPGPGPEPADGVTIAIPDSVERVMLLGDGDSEPMMTRWALERAARRLLVRPDGRERRITLPMAPLGLDFNGLLRGQGASTDAVREEMAA